MELGILVIDDEEGIRRSLSRILKEDGYSVRAASNGEEALQMFATDPTGFDVIICDLIMPGIDGIQTIERMNLLHQEPTKIILTGYGTLESSIKAIEAGVDGFITKPFENRELRWKVKECYIKRRMRQFIEPDIFNELLHEPAQLEPKMSRISILFSDIRGFTALSERVGPQELAILLNKHYFHPMSEIIKRRKGMVDKYIGDGIMALFGAPIPHENHEEDAVLCAVDMMKALTKTRSGFDIGIGISTGNVITGMFGSASKKEYTALGMPVNIAARLQKLARSGQIVISEQTRLGLNGTVSFEETGTLTFAPSSAPVVYYRWARDDQI
jgi:adenylate cyclase